MANALIQLRIDEQLKEEAAVTAMRTLSRRAEDKGVADMALEEINAEIDAVRNGE